MLLGELRHLIAQLTAAMQVLSDEAEFMPTSSDAVKKTSGAFVAPLRRRGGW